MISATLTALLVLVLVAAATLAPWLVDRLNARARITKERLAAEKKAPERAAEEQLALDRDSNSATYPLSTPSCAARPGFQTCRKC
jgi:hypothetical protein